MTDRRRAPSSSPDRDGFERESELIRVLANPKRLRILSRLARGPSTVTEIARELGLSLQNTSQHLRVMRDRSIVRARRDGHEVRYALTSPVVSEACRLVRQALVAGGGTGPGPRARPGAEPSPAGGIAVDASGAARRMIPVQG